jgi:Zn-dependent protease with chaperone function
MQQPDPAQLQHMAMAMVPMFMLFGLISIVIVIIPFWVIFKKAGMSPFLSLLMLIPIAGVVMLYVLAFSQWKVVPASEFGAGYPPAYPPPGYAPAAVYPPPTPTYVPPPDRPTTL